ncbi:hypothetical protein B296_00026790 [Ensete ventricosum]|uniref:Uncharacterized protein n=1 Tax=Ensete ventricosum TaxID=4639 RepID=A0A426YIM3_ENSVE|nr:hypothetical protein B296_00026790 [Ensete ventricosum]
MPKGHKRLREVAATVVAMPGDRSRKEEVEKLTAVEEGVGVATWKRKKPRRTTARGIGYSPRVKEASSRAPIEKKSHKERLTTVETRLDVLEASLEELYQGQRRLLGVESSQEEAESRIEKVESLVDQLTEDTKDSV